MKRVCFLLKVKKDKVNDYLRAHKVWPEMRQAISEAGIKNYSMFVRKNDGLLVGYFEAEDPEASLDKVSKTDISRRWQVHLAEYFECGSGDLQQGTPEWLEEYFYLE